MKVTIRTTGSPQYLVLGQSFSSGWAASVEGGRNLGSPQLMDAYANGWYLPAQPAGKTLVIDIHWRPQTVIWAALSVSAASILVCVGLAVWPERAGDGRRRSARPRRVRYGFAPLPASLRAFLMRPPPGMRPAARTSVIAAVGWGLAVALVSRPLIGLIAAIGVVGASSLRYGRLACRATALAVLVAMPVYAVTQQSRHHYWPDINWPANMSSANDIAWLGLALLGSDLLAGALYARARMKKQA